MSSVVLMIVNDADFFLSHRLAVAEGARDGGYRVCVATMPGKGVEEIEKLGLEHYVLPMSRSGRGPVSELKAFVAVFKLLKRLRPDVLHLVTIKPVLYGGVAARLLGLKGVAAAISGLGFVFISKGMKAFWIRSLVKLLYRVALHSPTVRVIFQNSDDRDVLVRMNVLDSDQVEIIRGSGVDLTRFRPAPDPDGIPVVCMAARLLLDKGVREFVDAARLANTRGAIARFQLIGGVDPGNPASVTEAELEHWRSEGDVELLGHRSDMAELINQSSIVVLPSYREGLPKVLVEAAACGRPVVTTDVPGCRDAIEPGETGLLVPRADAAALANAIVELLNNPVRRQAMGRAGRRLAEREFAIEKIVEQHLRIYRKLENS